MKKMFMLLAAGLIFGTAAMAQVASPVTPLQETKKADVLEIKEQQHDFGKIAQGKPVTTEFWLKNTGTDSLNLEMVQAGCGCTTPEFTRGMYAPGATIKIKVGYNAAAEGAFTKPVTITYNGGQQKVITITGTVVATPATPAPQNGQVGKIQG